MKKTKQKQEQVIEGENSFCFGCVYSEYFPSVRMCRICESACVRLLQRVKLVILQLNFHLGQSHSEANLVNTAADKQTVLVWVKKNKPKSTLSQHMMALCTHHSSR